MIETLVQNTQTVKHWDQVRFLVYRSTIFGCSSVEPFDRCADLMLSSRSGFLFKDESFLMFIHVQLNPLAHFWCLFYVIHSLLGDFTALCKWGQYFCECLVRLCYFEDTKQRCGCLLLFFSLFLMLICAVDWVSLERVLLSQPQLSCQLLEESRPLRQTCKVKDSTVVVGNKRV